MAPSVTIVMMISMLIKVLTMKITNSIINNTMTKMERMKMLKVIETSMIRMMTTAMNRAGRADKHNASQLLPDWLVQSISSWTWVFN